MRSLVLQKNSRVTADGIPVTTKEMYIALKAGKMKCRMTMQIAARYLNVMPVVDTEYAQVQTFVHVRSAGTAPPVISVFQCLVASMVLVRPKKSMACRLKSLKHASVTPSRRTIHWEIPSLNSRVQDVTDPCASQHVPMEALVSLLETLAVMLHLRIKENAHAQLVLCTKNRTMLNNVVDV